MITIIAVVAVIATIVILKASFLMVWSGIDESRSVFDVSQLLSTLCV